VAGELDLAAEALRNAATAVPVETLGSADGQLSVVAEYVQQAGGGLAEELLSSIAASRADGADLRQRLEVFRRDLESAAAGVAGIGGTGVPPSGETNRPRPVATPPASSPSAQPGPDPSLIAQAQAAGHKIDPAAVVKIGRDSAGKLIWLEKGNARGGLMHMNTGKRGGEFAQAGVAAGDVADVVFNAAATGKPVGVTGRDRVVYATEHQGRPLLVAVTVGANGYIVGANPVHQSRKLKPLP
jgi:hypothetical protein